MQRTGCGVRDRRVWVEMRVLAAMDRASRSGRALARRVIAQVCAFPALRGIDLSSLLIRTADRLETTLGALPRQMRSLARYSLARLTAGLVWRSAAAVTGIGMAAALVTGLSAEGSAPRLAGTLQPEPVSTVRDVRQQPRLAMATPVEWQPLDHASQRIALPLPPVDLPQRRTWRQTEGGRSLEEAMSVGALAEPRGHLVLRIRSGPAAQAGPGPFNIHFIRQAADHGVSVDRTGLPVALATSWGTLDAAEIVLGDSRTSRACLAFRSIGIADAALSGWWCTPEGGMLDLAELRCIIDRLEIEGLARSSAPSCTTERSTPPKPVRSAVNERDRRERTR